MNNLHCCEFEEQDKLGVESPIKRGTIQNDAARSIAELKIAPPDPNNERDKRDITTHYQRNP